MPRASSATTYSPLKVLFVANGSYSQETYIQNHLTALGATVTKIKDYNVKSTTNFAAYIIDAFTDFYSEWQNAGQEVLQSTLTLWYTTSVWHGDIDHTDGQGVPGAYGVYTTSTTQGWLEVAGGIVGPNL